MHKNKTYSRFIKFYFPILSFIKNRKFKKSIKKRYLLCESVEDLNTKSQVFCMAPWVHFHLLPNGIVTPCCLTPYHIAFGNAHDKKLIKIWNSSRFRKLRKQMLAGIKSDICNECYGYESVNKHSFRMYFNSTYRNEFKLVKSTHSSGYLDKMNIRYFDVRFSNLCNFKCRGCGPDLSSSWQGDSEKLFDRKPATLHVVNCTEKGSNHIWEQLTTFIPNVHELFFAGGEPLLMEEHYKALDILLKNGRKDATISYVTNLSTLQFKQYNLFDLWKNFKKLNINVSVDDIEKRGEYFRKGTKWDNLINNLNTVREKAPHANLRLAFTISLLNIYYIPETYRFFIENNFIHEDKFDFNIVKNPQWYNCQILPIGVKKKIEHKLTCSVSQIKVDFPGKNFKHYEQFIGVIIHFLYQKDFPDEAMDEFYLRNKKLDEIRNDHFEETYPELAELFEHA